MKRPLALSAILLALAIMSMISGAIAPTHGSSSVATDGEVGNSSVAAAGGQKLIVDSYGKHLAVYVDKVGRVGLVFANIDPTLPGAWSAAIKSPQPVSAYKRPAAVLVSPNSLRLIAEGGSGAQNLAELSVTLSRDSSGNIIGAMYGTPATLDSSGIDQYPTAIMAHDGSIILAWNERQNGNYSSVNGLRWTASSGWRSLSDPNSTTPAPIIAESSNNTIIPSIIERPDNYKLYVIGNRGGSSASSNLVFNSATYNGVTWTWGTQNLSFETSVQKGVEDAPTMIWNPANSTVVVAYAISSSTKYGVFTLDSGDRKVHLDTPPLSVTAQDWGTIAVDGATGDYYLFFMNVPSDAGSGPLVYARRAYGSVSWNASLTVLDASTNNMAISLERSTRPGLELLYSTGTTSPTTIRFFSLSPVNLKQSTISLTATPNQSSQGQTVSFSGSLTNSSGAPIAGRTVEIQQSFGSVFWTNILARVTAVDGSYSASKAFSLPTTYHLRAVFDSDSVYLGAVSPLVDEVVTGTNSSTFTFAAAGDHDATSSTSSSLNTLANSGVSFYLALGDLSYGSMNETSWCNYVKSNVGSTFPFQLISGNHEDGLEETNQGLIDNFASCLSDRVGGSGTYAKEYYFDYPAVNPTARIILISPTLNFTIGGYYSYKVGTSHYDWLSNAIDSARASGIPWVIVGMHKPCISEGASSGGCPIGSDLMNLLIQKRVDLVLQAHDHTYQRSKQLTCATVNSFDSTCVANDGSGGIYQKGAGTELVIAGLFGAGLTKINATQPEAAYFTKGFGLGSPGAGHGFVEYTVSPDRIVAQLVMSTGGNFTDSFTIGANAPPALAVPGPQTVNEGSPTTFSISATDTDIPAQTITLSASGLPTGATFTSVHGNPASGSFSWTPSEAQGPGDYTVAFTATDNGVPAASTIKSVLVHVNEVNSPPVLSVPGPQVDFVSVPLTFKVNASDPDIPAEVISLSASGVPANATFDPATGVFSWTPATGQAGNYTISFTATDNGVPSLSTSSAVAINVKPVLQPRFKSGAQALTWTTKLSLSRNNGIQTWTAKITNPNPTLNEWVNVRIVGTDTTGKVSFTAYSGPVQVLAGQTKSTKVTYVFDSGSLGLTYNFTAYIDWGLSSTSLTQTSTSTMSGSFTVVK